MPTVGDRNDAGRQDRHRVTRTQQLSAGEDVTRLAASVADAEEQRASFGAGAAFETEQDRAERALIGRTLARLERRQRRRLAQTIARETGAGLLKLNNGHDIGKDDMKKGVTFISLMEDNLNNLKTGLSCP